jgi:hypothetical protein
MPRQRRRPTYSSTASHKDESLSWKIFTRDYLQPLLGSAFLIHEVFFATEPRTIVMGIGGILVGGPLAAAADRWLNGADKDR